MRMRDESGGSLVELAIVVILLFVIVFGIIEFGILLYDKAMITNASREGARAGIVFDPGLRNSDNTVNDVAIGIEVEQAIQRYCGPNWENLISLGGSSTGIISPLVYQDIDLDGVIGSGDTLEVSITYPFRFLVFSNLIALLGGGAGNLVNLSAVTVMRLE